MEITFHADATTDAYSGVFRSLVGWTVEVETPDGPEIGEIDPGTDEYALRLVRYVDGEAAEIGIAWDWIRAVVIL